MERDNARWFTLYREASSSMGGITSELNAIKRQCDVLVADNRILHLQLEDKHKTGDLGEDAGEKGMITESNRLLPDRSAGGEGSTERGADPTGGSGAGGGGSGGRGKGLSSGAGEHVAAL